MTSERWRLIERLYHAAVERKTAERASALDQSCGVDATLKREVESLLDADRDAQTFLDESALRVAALEIADGGSESLVGRQLGSYELLARLDVGGMGEVYRARDVRLDRIVAIKILAPQLAGDPEFARRFHREARTISQLSHPHICTLYDVGHEAPAADGEPSIDYLVLQYLEGETLAVPLGRGPLPIDRALQRAIEIAEALAHAHSHGVAHGDLKPGNIIVTESGATLVDFGLARHRPVNQAVAGGVPAYRRPSEAPETQTILGTLPYMAPEQFEGRAPDARADIWAFGAVLYEMLSGRRAFGDHSEARIISGIIAREPEPLLAAHLAVPRELDHLVRCCLAKQPDQRPATADDIVAKLRAVADQMRERRAAWRQRDIARLSAAAAVIAAALLGAAALLRQPSAPKLTTAGSFEPVRTAVSTSLAVSAADRDLADVTTSSSDAYRYYAEGVRLHERGRDAEAADQLRRAVEIDPGFAMAFAKLAIAESPLIGSDRQGRSERDSRRALEHASALPDKERYYIQAIDHLYHRQPEQAIEAFTRVLALNPDHISSRQSLAAAYISRGRYEAGLEHLEKLRRRGVPLFATYFQLSKTYQMLGKKEKSVEVIDEFLRRNPDNARAYRLLGEALEGSGRLDDALRAYSNAAALDPGGEENDTARKKIVLMQGR